MSKLNTLLFGASLGLCYLPQPASATVIKEGDITVQITRTGPDRYEAQMSGTTVGGSGGVTSFLFEHPQDAQAGSGQPAASGYAGLTRRFSLMVQPLNMGQCQGSELVGTGNLASIRLPLTLLTDVQQDKAGEHYLCGSTHEQEVGAGQELGMVVGLGNRFAATTHLEGAKFEQLSHYYGQRVLLGTVTLEALDSGSSSGRPQRAQSNIYLDFSGLRAELDDLLAISTSNASIPEMTLTPGESVNQKFGLNMIQRNQLSDELRRNPAQFTQFSVSFHSLHGNNNFLLNADQDGHKLAYSVAKEGLIWNNKNDRYQFDINDSNSISWDFSIVTDQVPEGIKAGTVFDDTLTVIVSPAG